MIFRVILSLGLAMSLSCCKSRASEDSSELADGSKSKKAKVIQGYDLTGFKTLDAAPKDMICTTVLRPEEAACQDAGGKTFWADKCKPLCSIPVAPKGKVAGYNFTSFVVADALPEDMACAAIVSAEQEACFKNSGKTQVAKNCKYLCSVPISPKGKVSGFNFQGPQISVSELPKDHACAQVVRPEEEACRRAGGKITIAEKCSVICSKMISP